MSETPVAPVLDFQTKYAQHGAERTEYVTDRNDYDLEIMSREIVADPDARIYLDQDDTYRANHLFDAEAQATPVQSREVLSHADQLKRTYEFMTDQQVVQDAMLVADRVEGIRQQYGAAA